MELELTVDVLLVASKVNGLDTTDLLLDGASGDRSGDGTNTDSSTSSSNESSLLDAGSRSQLAGHGGTESLGEVSGGHCDDVTIWGLRGECLRKG